MVIVETVEMSEDFFGIKIEVEIALLMLTNSTTSDKKNNKDHRRCCCFQQKRS